MTRRRDLEHQRDSLGEIGEILSSMRTLAYMETRKLSRFLSSQQHVVESIAEVAADFLAFFPGRLETPEETLHVYLVVGSERGFCGDFNRVVAKRLAEALRQHQPDEARIIGVGHKLHNVLEDDESVVALLDGASVAEEVTSVLESLTRTLDALRPSDSGVVLYGVYHDKDEAVLVPLLPPFVQESDVELKYAFPPILNVPADEFLRDLEDHYLFAALNHMLYASLMSENQRRVRHLEGAVRHLEEESGELTRKCRALRQEEIVEEIEVILLSAGT
jgi:F-type H+-transporting ATPase subunit gamma